MRRGVPAARTVFRRRAIDPPSRGGSAGYSSLFRSSVARRLGRNNNNSNKNNPAATPSPSTRVGMTPDGRGRQSGDVVDVEGLVRDRLRREFPHAFGSLWDHHPVGGGGIHNKNTEAAPLATLASFRTLLELNGYSPVAKPSGIDDTLYLAEGVVATPPFRLSFDARTIPFASGYQEFAREQNLDKVGVFGDVHHLLAAPKSTSTDRLFAKPVAEKNDDDGGNPNGGGRNGPRRRLLPVLVQEDHNLYRMAETSAARLLDGAYSRITGWTQRRIVRPLTNARYRTRVAIRSANALRARLSDVLERSLAERAWEGLRNQQRQRQQRLGHSETAVTATNTSTSGKSSNDSNNIVAAAIVEPSSSDGGGSRTASNSSSSEDEDPVVGGKRREEEKRVDTGGANGSTATTIKTDDDTVETPVVSLANAFRNYNDDPLETLVTITSRPGRTWPARGARHGRGVGGVDEIVDSVALFERMTPATRILALPDYYVLRHSSASTLVSVSLVVFGALPLAYRSYVFSIDYGWVPGAGPIAATSVLATILYYIVVGRWRARTSQNGALHEALGARVSARDEAALLLLREDAVRAVAGAVTEAAAAAATASGATNNDDEEEGDNRAAVAVGPIDPRSWAIDLGLLPPPADDDDDDNKPTDTAADAPEPPRVDGNTGPGSTPDRPNR